ncbi:hypothetical protein, partial [Streptomyces sp. SID5643]|uniref:hypothetical protein n=1 Tax=Streptomyces sp. SID5643 TaxID=2690307 RepID=UPI001F166CE7
MKACTSPRTGTGQYSGRTAQALVGTAVTQQRNVCKRAVVGADPTATGHGGARAARGCAPPPPGTAAPVTAGLVPVAPAARGART